MAAKAGRLQIQLEMQVASLQRDLDRATASINKSTSQWKLRFSDVFSGNIAAQFVTSIGNAAVRVVADMGKIADESKKLGDTAEMYQRLAYAGDQAGVSIETIVSASGKLQKALGEGSKETEAALAKLGLTLADIKKLSAGEAFIKVGGQLGELGDTATQAAVGSDLFSKGWQALLPVLDDGEAALRRQVEAAEASSAAAVKAGDDFGDMVAKVRGRVSVYISEALAPLLKVMTDAMRRSMELGDEQEKMAAKIAGVQTDAEKTGKSLADLGTTMLGLKGIAEGVGDSVLASAQKYIAGWTGNRAAFDQAATDAESAWQRIKTAWSLGNTSFVGVQSAWNATGQTVVTAADKAAEAAEKAEKAAAARAAAEKAASEAAAAGAKAQAAADRDAAAAKREREAAERDFWQGYGEMLDEADDQEKAAADQQLKLRDAKNLLTAEEMRYHGAQETTIALWLLQAQGANDVAIEIEKVMQQLDRAVEKREEQKKKRDAEMEQAQHYKDILKTGIDDVFYSMQQGSEEAIEAVKRLVIELITAFLTAKALQALGLTPAPTAAAKGLAFNQLGMMAFAQGGVVTSPTPFTFGAGQLGVMGEAGAEAIMPLARGPTGKLGVSGFGNVQVFNYAGANVSVQRDEDNLRIMVDKVRTTIGADIARGGSVIANSLERAYGVRR